MFRCKGDTPCERKIIEIIISTGTVAPMDVVLCLAFIDFFVFSRYNMI